MQNLESVTQKVTELQLIPHKFGQLYPQHQCGAYGINIRRGYLKFPLLIKYVLKGLKGTRLLKDDNESVILRRHWFGGYLKMVHCRRSRSRCPHIHMLCHINL